VKAWRFVVQGRVQGVGYRAFVRRRAAGLDVRGSVRNREDGAVVVLAQGTDRAVAELEAALWSGPSLAHVTSVVRIENEDEVMFLSGFKVEY
jgi:acylphosphatase